MLMVLFMRGAFSMHDVEMASYSLMAYGMVYSVLCWLKYSHQVITPCQDTKTPVRYGIIAMITNMGFNLLFAILLICWIGDCDFNVSIAQRHFTLSRICI